MPNAQTIMGCARCLLLDHVCTTMIAAVVTVIIHLITGNSKEQVNA